MSHCPKPSSCPDQPDVKTEINQHSSDLQSILAKQLGPEYLSTRPGAGGSKLTYIEGWRVIALANEVFGYDGWSSETKTIEVDFVDQAPDGRFSVGVSAVVKITLKNGTSHEDVGYGKLENSKSKADALDKCKKEAVTDALKRTMRTFGNLMGNCLYDKSFLNNIKTMQAQKEKFLPSKLYRPDHVNNRSSTTTDTKPCDNQSSSEEKEFVKPKLPATVSNNLTAPKVSVAPVTKPTAYKRMNQVVNIQPNPPQVKIPEKRKFQEDEDKRAENNVNPAEEIVPEQQETMDGSIPFPATLSDNYFDLDENDLAELDNVECSEIFGIQSGPGGSGDESGLITDASVQLDDQSSTTIRGPAPIHQHQNPVSKNDKVLDRSVSRPPVTSTTPTSNSTIRFNAVSSVRLPQRLPSKSANNPPGKPTLSDTSKVVQAGQLPNIRS